MRTMMNRIFLQHPATVEETYFEHMRFAGWFSFTLFRATLAALIHALIPCLFEKTAGNLIKQMHSRIENRH